MNVDCLPKILEQRTQEIQSLQGKLNLLCPVCRPERPFCYRILLVLLFLSKVRHPIIIYSSSVISKRSTVVESLSSDLEWQELFRWRLLDGRCGNDLIEFLTDASQLAFGAYSRGVCLYSTFCSIYSIYTRRSIAFKKLFPVRCPHCMGSRTRKQAHLCFAGETVAEASTLWPKLFVNSSFVHGHHSR